MSKSYVFGELEIEEPSNNQTRLEKLQLVASDHWKNILIGGLSEIIIVASVALLTYLLTRQPICETGFFKKLYSVYIFCILRSLFTAVSTISTLATSTLPITTKSSTTHWSTSSTPISSTSPTSGKTGLATTLQFHVIICFIHTLLHKGVYSTLPIVCILQLPRTILVLLGSPISIINAGSWSLGPKIEQMLTRLAIILVDRPFSQSETIRYQKKPNYIELAIMHRIIKLCWNS